MKSHNLPGIIKTGLLFKATIMILCLSVSGWIGFAQIKTGKIFDCNSPNVELNRFQTMIRTGSNEFYRSYSDALKVMAEYEKAAKQTVKFNFSLARSKNKSAISKMQNTQKIYGDIVKICSQRNFSSIIKDKWLNIDYEDVSSANKIPKKAPNEVKQYLKGGDILGLYKKKIEHTNEIIEIMKGIDYTLEMEAKPDVSVFWKLLQKYSKFLTFENHSINALNTVLLKNPNSSNRKWIEGN